MNVNKWMSEFEKDLELSFGSSCVYLFTTVFPELPTVPTSQEEFNNYFLNE